MSDNNRSEGIGFTGLLQLAFIVLKFCNVITWSWWWVLSPAWITAGIVVLLLAVIGVIRLFQYQKDKKVVTRQGEIKSKWQERLEEMKEAQEKLKARRNA